MEPQKWRKVLLKTELDEQDEEGWSQEMAKARYPPMKLMAPRMSRRAAMMMKTMHLIQMNRVRKMMRALKIVKKR